MTLQGLLRQWTLVACATLVMGAGSAVAQQIPLVTGEHWTTSTADMKKAYLIGIANTVQLETEFAGNNPAADTQSVIPRIAKGMKRHSLDTVRDGLDRYYAANPDKLKRPVIETIWFEMVVPGLKS